MIKRATSIQASFPPILALRNPLRLVIVRHAESTGNVGNVLSGWTDVPLSIRGEQQVAAVAERLSDHGFDLAFTSDLQRARRTAEGILEFHVECNPEISRDFRERGFGEFEGVLYTDYCETLDAFQGKAEDFVPPGGESLAMARERVAAAFSSVIERVNSLSEEELSLNVTTASVLIVAHGSFNKSLLQCIFGLSYEERAELTQRNASVTELVITSSGAVETLSIDCVDHLANVDA